MAFETEKLSGQTTIATNLAGYISSQLTLLRNQQIRLNNEAESRYQQAVLEQGLSLEDQLSYRQEQLKGAKDKDERRRIRDEIASLKNQIASKKVTDDFLDQLESQNNGMQSIDATINWLKTTIANNTDPKIISQLQTNLNTLEQQRFTLQKDTLDKATTFAVNDKTESVLNDQISKVTSAKNKAILAGDDQYVATLNLQLQNLNKTLNESKITKAISGLSVGTLTGQSALATLDQINTQINSADTSTPITIGGVSYNSPKDFWTAKLTDFLNDSTANGFFTRYQNEINDKINYQVSTGTFKTDSLSMVRDAFNTIKGRPELSSYAEKINQVQQSTMDQTAQARATQVLNQFAIDLDASKASNELSAIQNFYGVDMTTNYQKLVLAASQKKDEQLKSILSATATIMQQNPGMSQDKAFQQAIQQGAGATISPESQVTKTPTQQFQELNSQTTETAGPKTTVDNTNLVKPNFTEGGVYKLNNSSTVYKFEGGSLRPVATTSEEDFKSATGKTYGDVQSIASLGNTPIGAVIQKQSAVAPSAAPATPSPEAPLTNSPQPQGVQMPNTSPAPSAAPAINQPSVVNYDSYQVKAGDSLSKIAQQYYQDPKKFQQIYDANKDILKNPNQIKPGQTLKIPKL